MDPIAGINFKKDSTLAMLLAARAREFELYYMEMGDLFLRDGVPYASMRPLDVHRDPQHWFDLGSASIERLDRLDVLLMRKDPPFDMEFVQCTYLLERAEELGVLVVNRPQSLRDCNEKMFTAWFAQCTPPTLVTRSHARLNEFLLEHADIVVKPLDGMGGASVFRVQRDGLNINVVFETLTQHEQRYCMAQRYVPEIIHGDKRILVIDGQPVDFALARVPAAGELRGNLAAGAVGKGVPLGQRERWICDQVAPQLKARGLLFVGLDVIGDYLTEINVTSPTCIRELDDQFGLDIGGQLMDVIRNKLDHRH